MRKRGSGHIVNVSTLGIDFPALRWSAYIASKAAFEAWLGGVAPEIRADGVTATTIHLQLVRSPMLGPFRIWRYVPGMSTDEAAGIVARAIVARPRVIAPPWARMRGVVSHVLQGPVEQALARHAARANPASRHGAASKPGASLPKIAREAAGAVTTIVESRALRPVRPDRLAYVLSARRHFGSSTAFAAAAAAELHGERVALHDELSKCE